MAGSGTALTERGERKQGKERARKQEEGINKRKQGRSKALIIHVIIMSKCGRKKYMRTNVRQMTMETVESQQDQSVTHSVAEHSSAHMQTGQISVPTLAQVSVAGSGTGRGSPAVTLVQLPSGQTVQVQGVIQTPHPSVIQSPQIQTVQVATIAETDDSAESEVIDSHKRREILSRRPSYRKILNELSSDVPGIPKIEEEKSEEEGTPPNIATMAVPTSIYQTSTGQYTATGDMPTYQIRAPTTALPQGVVMAASPGSLHSPQQLAEEATRKRELRLMKNREAARECRRKKKEYVKCLENRVAVLENQNKTLIEELKALKDLYCHKAE
ncbi:cAMP-responsive element modulator isoform X11 [Meriones unguiculatus]|uniref:cAMP-responsive element modulator isoform X11 n=2 Tax=Gerbillinae TaxID=10045 RepID=UPI00293F4C14|nr:cAMP-responsive element modulator isoform X11 [Meriones unguiculatus]